MNETDLSTLRAFLADRDVPCPACGYNLRGAQEPVCPECGGAVELSLGRRHRGVWVLLVAAMAWVAGMSGMDTARAVRSALDQSRVGQSLNISFSSRSSVQWSGSFIGGSTTFNTTTPRRTILPSAPAAVSAPPTSITINRGPNAPKVTVLPGGVTMSRAPVTIGSTTRASTLRVWSQVGTATWVAMGGWSALACAGLMLLALVIIRRRALRHEGPSRVLLAACLALVALQLGAQAFLFVRELVG